MTSGLIVFIILAIIAIAAAVGLVFSRNSVYSALFLIVNFMAVAVIYLVMGAPFIALAQITVYAGAIMVLFLFVIMLLGVESLAPSNSLPWQKPLAFSLAVILVVESVYLLVSRAQPNMMVTAPDIAVNSMDNLREMAMTMFNQFLLPFEVTSVLLLVAMVGAIVLTNREKVGRK